MEDEQPLVTLAVTCDIVLTQAEIDDAGSPEQAAQNALGAAGANVYSAEPQ